MISKLSAGEWIRVVAARSSRDAWDGQIGQVIGRSSQPGGLIQVAFGRNIVRFFQDEIELIEPPEDRRSA